MGTGVALSIIILIYKSTIPHMAILGKIPGTHFYRNTKRFNEVEIHDEILIIRFDAQLHFANTDYFKLKGNELKLLILDGESINRIDSSAIFTLIELLDYFNEKEVTMAFASLKGPVRDKIINSGFMEKAN